jgi:integrase/recombinase XerD
MQKTLRQYQISIVLDKRRRKNNDKYPVKLRVFCKSPKIQKLYPTQFEYTESEFSSIWESQRVKQEYKSIRQ